MADLRMFAMEFANSSGSNVPGVLKTPEGYTYEPEENLLKRSLSFDKRRPLQVIVVLALRGGPKNLISP